MINRVADRRVGVGRDRGQVGLLVDLSIKKWLVASNKTLGGWEKTLETWIPSGKQRKERY